MLPSSKRKADGSTLAEDEQIRMQPRRAHAAPSDDATAVAASPLPAVGVSQRLHRHALESVFAFCRLADLPRVMQVCQDWRAAVQTMRPLNADMPRMPVSARGSRMASCVEKYCADRHMCAQCTAADQRAHVQRVCQTPMARHVSRLRNDYENAMTPELLSLLAERMPQLSSLDCRLGDAWAPLVFPPRLRVLRLDLRVFSRNDQAALIDDASAAIRAVATLPLLESLKLWLPREILPGISFAPLAEASALRELIFRTDDRAALVDDTLLDALRAMPQLRVLDCKLSPAEFDRLTHMPHQMQLQRCSVPVPFDGQCCGAVTRLPSLTELVVYLQCKHADFLSQLPNLTDLRVGHWGFGNAVPVLDCARVLRALSSLHRLTSLSLWGDELDDSGGMQATSEQLAECLPQLPLLRSLTLSNQAQLESLEFLKTGPVTRTLTSLELKNFHMRLPVEELQHVNALSALETLTLENVFDEPLAESTQQLYRRPSRLLPSLRWMQHSWRPLPEDEDEDDEEEEEEEDA